jgi:glycosyltransferase involved in cell wall biosynthesis
MADAPLVTALLPLKAYDPVFLRRALDSVLRQTSPSWRLIVVVEEDDLEHFRTLLADDLQDPRVLLVTNRSRGFPGALNTGLRRAETEFCAFLLGDDMWAPEAVEVLEREIAAHPETDFFHSARVRVDEEDRPIGSVRHGSDQVRPEDFLRAAPVKHLLCFRREMALELGGIDESFQVVGPDDYDFPWSMAERGAKFRAVPEVLYHYREHHRCDRLTTTPLLRERRREIARMWRKHGAGGVRGRLLARRSTRAYLRKGLYRNRLDRWVKRRLTRSPEAPPSGAPSGQPPSASS